jgi:hypothetical protein
MIPLLLIDDVAEYCITLNKIAKLKDFDIHYCTNYEEGFQKLMANPDLFCGIILDARCYKDKESETNRVTKDSGVFYAITTIRNYILSINRPIPFCVNTGFSASFRENIEEMGISVFDKLSDRDRMLLWFKEQIELMPETIVKNRFPDVFETFRMGFLDSKTEKRLITILEQLEKETSKEIKELLFNSVRQILEAVYKSINKIDDNVIPGVGVSYEKSQVNLFWCMLRLSAGKEFIDPKNRSMVVGSIKPVMPDYLGSMLHTITSVTNAKSHDNESYNYTYLVKGIVYGLLEIILWYKNFAISYKK